MRQSLLRLLYHDDNNKCIATDMDVGASCDDNLLEEDKIVFTLEVEGTCIIF